MIIVLSNHHRYFLLRAKNRDEALVKIDETASKYPRESQKYLQPGVRLIEADTIPQAKARFDRVPTITNKGEYKLF